MVAAAPPRRQAHPAYRFQQSVRQRRRRRILFRLSLLLLPLIAIALGLTVWVTRWISTSLEGIHVLPAQRPLHSDGTPFRIIDPSDALTTETEFQLEQRIEAVESTLQADVAVVILRRLNEDDTPAVEALFRQWRIGENGFGNRGILLAVGRDTHTVRLVYGEDLQKAGRALPLADLTTVPTDALRRGHTAEALGAYLQLLKALLANPRNAL